MCLLSCSFHILSSSLDYSLTLKYLFIFIVKSLKFDISSIFFLCVCFLCVCMCPCVYMHVCAYVCVSVCMYACVWACVCLCVCLHVCGPTDGGQRLLPSVLFYGPSLYFLRQDSFKLELGYLSSPGGPVRSRNLVFTSS